MENLLGEMGAEQTDWANLRTLEHVDRLDSNAVLQFNLTLNDARYRDWRLALVTDQLFEMANKLHVWPIKNSTAEDRSICLTITTTRAEANRVSVWPVGEP